MPTRALSPFSFFKNPQQANFPCPSEKISQCLSNSFATLFPDLATTFKITFASSQGYLYTIQSFKHYKQSEYSDLSIIFVCLVILPTMLVMPETFILPYIYSLQATPFNSQLNFSIIQSICKHSLKEFEINKQNIKKYYQKYKKYSYFISMSVSKKQKSFSTHFSNEVSTNVEVIKQAAKGYGFTLLNFNNGKDFNIVYSQDASQTLSEMIDDILIQVNEESLKEKLLQFHEQFISSYIDSKSQTIFQTRTDKTHILYIIRIFFYKKKTKCLLGYKITNFHYKTAPKINAITNIKNQNTNILVFFPSSSLYEYSEKFAQVDRGVDQEDMKLLLQLSSFGAQEMDQKIYNFIYDKEK